MISPALFISVGVCFFASLTLGWAAPADELQLQELGLNPGPADGIYGRQTEAALRQYQACHALPITGWPDEATRRSLEMQASEVQQRRPTRPTQHADKQRLTSEPERILNEVGGFFQRIFERK